MQERKIVNLDSFTTTIHESEAIINTQPLTYTAIMVKDSLILRSIDFLHTYANITFFFSENDDEEDGSTYTPTLATKDQ